MITYQFDGRPWHVGQDQLFAIVDFAVDRLQLAKYEQIFFDIIFSELGEGECGWCNGIDDEVIELEISSELSVEELAATIFHELCHARQVLEGRLIQGEGHNPSTWDGKVYIGYKYDDRPWEIEARQVEQQLMEEFFAEQPK